MQGQWRIDMSKAKEKQQKTLLSKKLQAFLRCNHNKSLELSNLLGLNHKEIENMKRPVMTKESESAIKQLPTKKNPGPDGFISEFYQICKDKSMSFLLKLF